MRNEHWYNVGVAAAVVYWPQRIADVVVQELVLLAVVHDASSCYWCVGVVAADHCWWFVLVRHVDDASLMMMTIHLVVDGDGRSNAVVPVKVEKIKVNTNFKTLKKSIKFKF